MLSYGEIAEALRQEAVIRTKELREEGRPEWREDFRWGVVAGLEDAADLVEQMEETDAGN